MADPKKGGVPNHGGASTGPKTKAGHDRCTAGRVALYNARKAAGFPAIQRRPKPKPAPSPAAPKWQETKEQREERVREILAKRYTPEQMKKMGW